MLRPQDNEHIALLQLTSHQNEK